MPLTASGDRHRLHPGKRLADLGYRAGAGDQRAAENTLLPLVGPAIYIADGATIDPPRDSRNR
jgi:hypothetical protein